MRRARWTTAAAMLVAAGCACGGKQEAAPRARGLADLGGGAGTGAAPAAAGAQGGASASPAADVAPTGPKGCGLEAVTWRYPAVARVIAIGDVHGDLAATRRALRLGQLIDEQDRWIGGSSWLLQTGDVLDRGDDEQAILDMFERLEGEARAAGGRFVWLLGNHELMNAAGDLRYVTPGGFRDFEDVPGLPLDRFADVPAPARARVAAFAPGGPYAQVLAGQAVVAIVGDTAFVHGGIVPGVAATLEGEQKATRCWLTGDGAPPGLLDRQDGPVWDRSLATPAVDCARLDRALAELGVARIVIGHTPQPSGVTSACDGKVWRIDVGLAAYYGGPTEVLELTGDKVRVLR